jgi:hypothetical protein
MASVFDSLIDPTSLVLNAYALLAGKTPGNSDLKAHLAFISATSPDVYKSTIDSIFKDVPTSQLATLMLTNLNLTSVFTQANAEDYLKANAGNRVGAMMALADILTTYTGTITSVVAAKTAYVNSISASRTFSTNTANTAGVPLSALSSTSSEPVSLQPGDDNLTGTSGDDSFSAIVSAATTSSNTLSAADAIDGAGGTGDRLNIRVIDNATGGTSVAPQASNVEKFTITNLGATTNNFFALDFTSISGETEVASKGSVAGSDTRALKVDALAASIDTAEGSFSVNFKGTRTAATDAFSLSLNGAGTAASEAVFATITTTGAADNSFDIANITSTGAASFLKLGTGAMNLKTVNVTGDAALVLTEHNVFSGLSTIDASGMTAGGVNVEARGSTEAGFVFKGGGGIDRVILAASTINSATTLSGGVGKDTLASTSFGMTPSVVNASTGFEVLESVSPTNGLVANTFTSINEFVFSGGANNGRVDITGVETSDRFVFSSDQSTNTGAIRFTGASIGQSVVMELRAVSVSTGEVTIQANGGTSEGAVSAIAFDKITSVTIDSTGQNTNANVVEAVKGNSSGSDYAAFDNSTTFSNFVVTGSQNLTIGATAGIELSGNARTVGFSGAVNLNASAFTGALRVAGSRSDDAIAGGSGDDIIYGLAGADTLTGNGGADQFRFVGSSGNDLIKDFLNGTDKIGFNTVNFGATTATAAGVTLAAADYIDNRSGVTAIGASDNNKVVELQGALSASQITSDAGAAVQAIVLLFNSTTSKGELWFDDNWSDAGGRSQLATFDTVASLVGVTAFKNTDFVEFVS